MERMGGVWTNEVKERGEERACSGSSYHLYPIRGRVPWQYAACRNAAEVQSCTCVGLSAQNLPMQTTVWGRGSD